MKHKESLCETRLVMENDGDKYVVVLRVLKPWCCFKDCFSMIRVVESLRNKNHKQYKCKDLESTRDLYKAE